MDQLGNDLKKVLQAGLGAVATGLEKAQGAIDDLSKKGEPIYEQAKAAVTDAVDKAKQAVSECAKPRVEDFIDDLRQFSQEELARVRAALEELAGKTASKEEPASKDETAALPPDGNTKA